MTRTRRKFSDEDKRRLVTEIQALVDSGIPITDAIEQKGVANTVYYHWKKKFSSPVTVKKPAFRKKTQLIEMPIPVTQAPIETAHIALFVGSSRDIKSVYDSIFGVRHE